MSASESVCDKEVKSWTALWPGVLISLSGCSSFPTPIRRIFPRPVVSGRGNLSPAVDSLYLVDALAPGWGAVSHRLFAVGEFERLFEGLDYGATAV